MLEPQESLPSKIVSANSTPVPGDQNVGPHTELIALCEDGSLWVQYRSDGFANLPMDGKWRMIHPPAESDQNSPPATIGTIIFEDTCRAEVRASEDGKLEFYAQFPQGSWDWIKLRDVETLKEVRELCNALGYESLE